MFELSSFVIKPKNKVGRQMDKLKAKTEEWDVKDYERLKIERRL